jgi:Tfp pilus assembly protein PilO
MSKLSKEKKDKLTLVIGATLGAIMLLYFLVISPQQAERRDQESKIATVRESVEKAERLLRMAPTVRANLNAKRELIEARHEHMAPLDKFKWFYNTLENFRAAYDVNLVDITREPEVAEVKVLPNFPYQSATFGVKLSASYHDFGRFLADFENRFPLMRVENLRMDMDPSSKSSQTNVTGTAAADAAERLAIAMRVVTLVKPISPL